MAEAVAVPTNSTAAAGEPGTDRLTGLIFAGLRSRPSEINDFRIEQEHDGTQVRVFEPAR